MPPTDPTTAGAERPPRSDIPEPAPAPPGDPAYEAWKADQQEAKAAEAAAPQPSPGDSDPEYQAYLADKAERDRVAQLALLDPEYAAWKAGKDAEDARIAAQGPSCPHCTAPVANPTGEELGYCWACGYGSMPEQAARYAEAVDKAAAS